MGQTTFLYPIGHFVDYGISSCPQYAFSVGGSYTITGDCWIKSKTKSSISAARLNTVNNGVKVQRGAGGKCSARGVDLFSITSGETLGKWMLPLHGEGRLWRLV